MPKQLDVLVVESHTGAATRAADALEAAGHRVFRCYDVDSHGFPCRGVVNPSDCPMNQQIDVALLVRKRITPRPTRLEGGVSCAIRASVPIVEDGPDILDPYTLYIQRRLREHDDVTAACVSATSAGYEPLASAIVANVGRLVVNAGGHLDDTRCRIEPRGSSLDVHLDISVACDRSLEQALAVRVLDAVRTSGRTVGNVDVHVHGSVETT